MKIKFLLILLLSSLNLLTFGSDCPDPHKYIHVQRGVLYCDDGLQFIPFYVYGDFSQYTLSHSGGGHLRRYHVSNNEGFVLFGLEENEDWEITIVGGDGECETTLSGTTGSCDLAEIPVCEGPLIIPLVENVTSNSQLTIWGHYISWLDATGQIWLYDIGSSENPFVISSGNMNNRPLIWGKHVIWCTGNGLSGGEIFLYEIDSGNPAAVISTPAGTQNLFPDIWGKYVIWRSYPDMPFDLSHSDIWIYNIETGIASNLTPDVVSATNFPLISGKNIVWYEGDQNVDRDIYL